MDKCGNLTVIYSGSGKGRFLGLQELGQSELAWERSPGVLEPSRCSGTHQG